MAAVVSIINLKGGVGKSTLTMILAEYLAFRFHQKVLLIDMDAQANLSYIMVPYRWIEVQEREKHRTLYDFFQSALSGQPRPLADFVARPPLMVSNINNPFIMALNRPTETIDMVISTPSVAQLEEDLLKLWEANKPMPANLRFALKESLGEVQDQYDVILIGTSANLLAMSAIAPTRSCPWIKKAVLGPTSLIPVLRAAARKRR